MNLQIIDIDRLHLTLHTEFPFDQSNSNWYSNNERNAFFVRHIEAIVNDRLKAQGYLFLNDVLDVLGIDRVQSGQIMGWGNNRDITDIVEIKIGFDENENMILALNPHRIILDLWELMQQTLDFSGWEETPEQKHERIDKILEKNTAITIVCIACREPITGTQTLLSTEYGYYHGAPMSCVEGRDDKDTPWWQR